MFNCDCLIHPFQNDPGTSQRQRIMDELLSGATKIDARTLADLLDYFVQLSRHINYYDLQGNMSDWQPFFRKSVPFTLASIIKYRAADAENNFTLYNRLFEKKPVATGLQLQAHFIYYHFIHKINTWHLALKDSKLPMEPGLELIIKDQLQQPVKEFIACTNAAVNTYGIQRIDFTGLYENKAWNIDLPELYASDVSFSKGTKSKLKQLTRLSANFRDLFPQFLDIIKLLSTEAEKNLETSLIHTKEELQQKHPPHLGLLFAFLNIFRYLQDDLNQYTRRHLDFFYKDILQLKPAPAVPDRAHVLFEIQQQLKKYMLKKGLLLKGGKDEKKQEILFELDDEIVVNKTTVADKRTLFLNNKTVHAETYVEGLYIATDAGKADGVDKEFQTEIKNFPTVGSKESKYTDPETHIIKPYPNARLGFILASPVLYLQGGKRKVTITLDCHLIDSVCGTLPSNTGTATPNCCNPNSTGNAAGEKPLYPEYYSSAAFFSDVNTALSQEYYYLSEDILKEALKKGVNKTLVENLRVEFGLLEIKTPICYCPVEKRKFDSFLRKISAADPLTPEEILILADLLKPGRPLNILFSGEKEWISPIMDPASPDNLVISLNPPLAGNQNFTLTVTATLGPDKPPVTFYSAENLKEEFNTTQPLVKIELDDRIKLLYNSLLDKTTPAEATDDCCQQTSECCLLKPPAAGRNEISLYHFFRDVQLLNTQDTGISVTVCNLKNFIVQNDESIQDVNAPVYPFGVRPKVDSNFYIGSEEIFIKKWSDIIVNLNWKDIPVPKPANFFKDHYFGYQDFFINAGVQQKVVLDDNFKVQIAVLQDGTWINRSPLVPSVNCEAFVDAAAKLFQASGSVADLGCAENAGYSHQFAVTRGAAFPLPLEPNSIKGIKRLDVNTRNSFLRITLKCQDFQHDRYPFILARQMSALGKLPDIVDGAVYYGVAIPGPTPVFETLDIPTILQEFIQKYNLSLNPNLLANMRDLVREVDNLASPVQLINSTVWGKIFVNDDPSTFIGGDAPAFSSAPVGSFLTPAEEHSDFYKVLENILTWLKGLRDKAVNLKEKGVVIPKEPWTPTISNIALDYKAEAKINEIEFIHLYPYKNTFRHEEIRQQPMLFPTFCDEGTLFIGLDGLVPGDNLNMLFQLAEATADSESEKEDIHWHYLDSNVWKPLRNGFEVLDDATQNLTTSGIVKFALPENMTKGNTVMPANLHWIKACIAKNSKAVSETTGIHTQAMLAVFTNADANDKLRLSQPLAAGSIAKLNQADASVKSTQQPYDSFAGLLPEGEGQFYVRTSELLRHKGRAIQPWDYERLALQAFPQIYKAKCISHSFALDAHKYKNDFPYAPGYVILAVIPDLYKLKAGNSFEPKVPVSLIGEIDAFIRKRISPFVRFRTMNPRYEKINFCLKVQLIKGKDENYYKEKMKQDIKEFLAPWAVGEYSKLTFGQCVYRSDIIRFLETRDYVDFITDLQMGKGQSAPGNISVICPDTPRSILVGGDIEVCINDPACEKWETGYRGCDGKIIDTCSNIPLPIMDYCKPVKT